MLQTSRQVLRRLVRQRHGRGEAGPRRHEAEKNDPAAKMVSETRALTESAICVLRFRNILANVKMQLLAEVQCPKGFVTSGSESLRGKTFADHLSLL